MVEKQLVGDREVWFRVEPYHVHRDNPNIIPTEYFTVAYFFQDPAANAVGEKLKDEDGEIKLFESPVAALGLAVKTVEKMVQQL